MPDDFAIQSIIEEGASDSESPPKPWKTHFSKGVSRRIAPIITNLHLEDMYDARLDSSSAINTIHKLTTLNYESKELSEVGLKLIPGEYRQFGVVVGGFVPPLPVDVPELMELFTDKLDGMIFSLKFKRDPKEIFKYVDGLTTFAGTTLLAIHPFGDGNGRTARAFMDYIEYVLRRYAGQSDSEIPLAQKKKIEEYGEEGFTTRVISVSPLHNLFELYYPKADQFFDKSDGNPYPRKYLESLRNEDREIEYYNKLASMIEDEINATTLESLREPPWSLYSADISRSRALLTSDKDPTQIEVLNSYLKGIKKNNRVRSILANRQT